MERVRNDLYGVIHTSCGVLRAGDVVPEGVVLSAQLLEADSPVEVDAPVEFDTPDADVEEPDEAAEAAEAVEEGTAEAIEEPAGNASAGAWRAFLAANGIDYPAEAKRAELKQLWDAHTNA